MRLLFALVAVALPGAGVVACAGAGKGAGSASHASSNTAASSAAVAAGAVAAGATSSLPPRERLTGRHLNDGDHDRVGDDDEDNNRDNDEDPYLDYKPAESRRYRDKDDWGILAYGHAADAADGRAVTAVVERYYALATAGDGARVCSTLPPSFVKAMPEDYGQFGPPYLRGGKTCRAVMVRLFRHSHRELSAPVAVTGVRVEGDSAYALLGSTKMPASYVTLQREHGVWTINGLLGSPLP